MKELDDSICIELNDLLYELQVLLPKKDSMQGKVVRVMKTYQDYFVHRAQERRNSVRTGR